MQDKRALLQEAELAYHKLMTGSATVRFGKGDREMVYNHASLTSLRTYIETLKRDLGIRGNRSRPARVVL